MGINSGRGWGLQKGLLVPSGKGFGVGWKEVRRMREVDPEGGGGEAPLREALERAQREFGYGYWSR